MKLRRVLLIVFVMLLGATPALAANPSTASASTKRPGHAAIASAHQLATDAGLEVLREGGNAFDAAVAVASTLSVVEPQSSGIGGGGFFLLHRAADGKDVMLDARETAPAASNSKLYEDKNGNPDRDKSLNGALAAGIPGEPAALACRTRTQPLKQSKPHSPPPPVLTRSGQRCESSSSRR